MVVQEKFEDTRNFKSNETCKKYILGGERQDNMLDFYLINRKLLKNNPIYIFLYFYNLTLFYNFT